MTIKPFAIQGADLTLGGVNLQAGTTGVVIPGVTQAVNYIVEEVNDTGDQTENGWTTGSITVIDHSYWQQLTQPGTRPDGWAPATYQAIIDDEELGYGPIDKIEVTFEGANLDSTDVARATSTDMWAIANGAYDFNNFDTNYWIQIPFRPRMRAGDVETIGGGAGGAIVERSVNFPTGVEGDQRGTIALTPDGETYVCTDDWVDNTSQYQDPYSVENSENYGTYQSGDTLNQIAVLASAQPDLLYIYQNGNWNPSDWTIDAGEAFGGVQTCSNLSYNGTTLFFQWPYRAGIDPTTSSIGDPATIVYSGTINQAPIWRKLVDLTSPYPGEGNITWTNEGDLTIETIRPEGYTDDCDVNIYAADDIWMEAKGDQIEIKAETQIELVSNTSYVRIEANNDNSSHWWTFDTDGSLKLPHLNNTGYQSGYSLNGPTLRLGGENDPYDQIIITGPVPDNNNSSAQRIVIQGQKGWGGENQSKGEGGDVYIWAGTGGDGGAIDSQGNGGDVKVRGGQGGAGGYVKVEGGDATGPGGTGGYIEITAGDGTNVTSGDGGDVRIKAGAGSGTGNNGEVHVYTVGTNNHWIFKNDGALQLPVGGDIRDSTGTSVLGGAGSGAQLVGDGYVASTGYQFTYYVDYSGSSSGGASSLTGVLLPAGNSISVGDVITFRTGEVRTIDTITVGPDGGLPPDAILYEWVEETTVESSVTDPAFPITVTSSDYVAVTKPTARIKPDSTYEGLGQWVDIYTGGAPSSMDDLGHIHMKGHHGNVELFLGTDDNFVSTKEAGTTPGHVTMRSESEIKVIETDIRTQRNGSTFVSDMGDNVNYAWHRGWEADLTFNTVAADSDGNYYIGGEHANYADGMISKFSKDGALLWSKLVGGATQDTAWDVPVVGVNPTTNKATILYTTNDGRSYEYFKLAELDADGNFEGAATDFYDVDGNITPRDMKWHPTLGWVIVGRTYGDMLASGSLSPQTGSGVGKLILNAANTDIRGSLMTAGDTSWYLSGTNITGKQLLDQGIGLFTGLTPTNLLVDNPAAGGAEIKVRINYSGSAYFGFSISDVTTAGTNYNTGDVIKIPGSQLGGVDGFTVDLVSPVVQNNNPTTNTVTIFAPKLNHAVLNYQVGNGSPVIGWGIPSGSLINNFQDYDANYWSFDIPGDFTPTGTISVLSQENDAIFTITSSGANGGITGSLTTSGTPELTNITINTSVLGYTTENFSTGTYVVYKQVSGRPFVWTNAWKKFLDMEEAYDYGYAASVAVNANDIDAIYVSGYTNGSRNGGGGGGFIWKLTSAGATSWVRGLDNQWEINTMAVAANGQIYASSSGMGSDITCFANNGLVINRIQPNGPYGGRLNIDIARGDDGQEYLYAIWSQYNVMGMSNNGVAVQKFNLSLEHLWSRHMYMENSNLTTYVDYNNNYRHFALTATQAVVVGYAEIMGNYNHDGQLWSMSITDDFEPTDQIGSVNGVVTGLIDLPWEAYGNTSSDDLSSVLTAQNNTIQIAEVQATLMWNPYTWSNRILNANFDTKGLVGVEKVDFVQGGDLGHNPADIPHSTQNLQADDFINWNITLKLSDRGKFIKNVSAPSQGYIQNLTVYVPKTTSVAFPVGSIITLINLDISDTYYINVEPVGYNMDDDAPRIWAAGMTTASIWGFKGVQTATLMKIGTNDWLLTANNIVNND